MSVEAHCDRYGSLDNKKIISVTQVTRW